jgi:hypothetical protein
MATPSRRFDGWGHHPAAFSFSQLEAVVDAVHPAPDGTYLDPFAGSGTSLTFVSGRGDAVIGIEAHPLMAELSALKLSRPGSGSLRDAVDALAEAAASARARIDLGGEPQLLREWMPADVLTDLVAWREACAASDDPWAGHVRWLVLGTLRDLAGTNWPYAHRARARPSKDVRQVVFERADQMTADLAAAPRSPTARVIRGDARDPATWGAIAPGAVSACISSPPYLNQVSYAEATRLELYFLGRAGSWREMNDAVGRDLVASCTQQVTVARSAEAQRHLSAFPAISASLASLARRLHHERRKRSRGKIYDLLLWAYFADLAEVLVGLRRALAPGARAAWVVGDSAPYDVHVDTPALLGMLAEEVGFQVLEDRHLRPRGHKWAGVGQRHAQLLSERLLVFARPGWGEQTSLPGF